MKWKFINIEFNCSVKACNFLYQITPNEILMFGGWHKGKTQTSIDVFDLEKCQVNEWSKEVTLVLPDMITKRPVVIGTVIAIQGRKHIHLVDLKTKEITVLENQGEDLAEQIAIDRSKIDESAED